ncbi:MAG TPA: cation-transporting P-type ATPase, partial [Smithella sp.]|nr:cation-transporting P-type ATPase [Smithella sp.]
MNKKQPFFLKNPFHASTVPERSVNAPSDAERRLIELCSVPLAEAMKILETSSRGLSGDEAQRRLDRFGPNELAHLQRKGFWADIFQRLKSPLVVQLLVIALISAFLGEFSASVIVGAMILLSVGLSYILDRRSSRAVDSLGKRVQSRTYVLRDGKEMEVRISEVVPGDIVLLQAGSIVPADLRLIAAKDFFVGESSLTGES